MVYADIITSALPEHIIEPVETPLHNMFLIDQKWLIEFDYDGGCSAYISSVKGSKTSSFSNRYFVVFSSCMSREKVAYKEVGRKVNKVIDELKEID